MMPFDQRWSIDQSALLASLLEAAAPKVGNVHPSAAFADMHFGHFVGSAAVIGSLFSQAAGKSVGRLVLECSAEVKSRIGRNTNLGTVLLLAPLAVAAMHEEFTEQFESKQFAQGVSVRRALARATKLVLTSLTKEDSRQVYDAIRLTNPGGLGHQANNDIAESPPDDLLQAMRQVSSIDAVARQYVDFYADIFERTLPWFDQALSISNTPLQAILVLQLRCLAWEPDGLIVRKCGLTIARHVQMLARLITDTMGSTDHPRLSALKELDDYLRADGHRRNPGTTADIVAATLFCRLLCGQIADN